MINIHLSNYYNRTMPNHLTDNNSENFKDPDNIDVNINAIIDFSATWCGPCMKMKPFYSKAEQFVKSIGLDVEFFVADVDHAPSLAKNYNVKAMPTLVLIKNGKIVAKKQGGSDDTGILTFIGAYFDINPKEDVDADVNAESDSSLSLSSSDDIRPSISRESSRSSRSSRSSKSSIETRSNSRSALTRN